MLILVANLQSLLQYVLIANHADVRVLIATDRAILCVSIAYDLMRLIDSHLLNDVRQQLYSLIWRKHLSKWLPIWSIAITSRSCSTGHLANIHCALHKLASMIGKVFAP